MFTLECDIRIGNYKFTQVNSVEIESSWRQIADTAKIKIPNLKASLEKVFKEGDPVSISLGYKDQYFGEEFTGFISQVKPNIPFEIHCEDYIYFLKRVNLKKSWREVT